MPPLICPRCQRVNPDVAVYCHYDGVVLRQNMVGAAVPGQLPQPFILPSSRACRTMEELAKGALDEWEDARELLHQGKFRQYFTSIGRVDLARAAEEAEREDDPDIGLHNFLDNLPVRHLQRPQLDLKPRRLNLTTIKPGEVKDVPLQIFNLGQGFLQGKLTIVEGEQWLKIRGGEGGAPSSNGQYPLQKLKEQQVILRVDTRGLPAPHSYNARIHVISNGGITEVPIRLDLGAIPFAHAPFQGVTTQRQMAERMVKKPKAAVPLLENGEIQRWFTANGWTWPVQGDQAPGVAAVQQFFEAMGVSKPPPCRLSETEVQCLCVPPEVAEYHVQLRTGAKKWVYAQVDSDVHWLRVTTPSISGAQKATIAFEVDSSLLDPGLHEGHISVVANAGQTMSLRVVVDVQPPHIPFTRRLLKPFFSFALLALLYRLLFIVPGDLIARFSANEGGVPNGTIPFWIEPAIDDNGTFLRQFVLLTWWIGTLTGAWLLWKKGSRWYDTLTGAIAGTMAGVAGAITIASLVTVVDVIPRTLMDTFFGGGSPGSAFLGTVLWLILALLTWMILGGAFGFLMAQGGRWGRQILSAVSLPFRRLFEKMGLAGAASFLSVQ